MTFPRIQNRLISFCASCKRKLLLNKSNHLCLACDNERLQQENEDLKVQLETALREKNEIYEKLCRERSAFVTNGDA